MNYLLIILFSILCLLVIKKLLSKNYIKKDFIQKDNDNIVTYDNKPLHQRALKRKIKNSDVKYNCRATIVECDKDSDCLNLCADSGNKSECINGFCAYVYDNDDDTFCQNGGTPVSYFFRGRFNYTGCICPATFIGRFCDIPNKMITLPS